ncbi:MAG: hypothetical protein AAF578_15380 [Pseudomonadota bacterium]
MPRFRTQQIDDSVYGEQGFFDAESQCQYVLASADRYVDESKDVYVIGHAGVDGIEFVLRPNDTAVYACMRVEDELVRLAMDFDSFIAGWKDRSITV